MSELKLLAYMTFVWHLAGLLFLGGLIHASEPAELRAGVQQAFLEVHQGWSAEEVILRDALNVAFLDACRRHSGLSESTDATLNWELLTIRKAGALGGKVTRRNTQSHTAYQHAAEIGARWVEDRYRMNIDRALCDPILRAEFDRVASEVAPGVEPYALRKSALGLRKRRLLRPELVGRVAEWEKEVSSFPLPKLQDQLSAIPEQPGIYLFRDESGYLYVGEASNLRLRIEEHLRSSDRASLAAYLARADIELKSITVEIHVFGKTSPGSKARYRRAYESELIASRKPRFNLRP
jgi:GIY-YIG catalytic domain